MGWKCFFFNCKWQTVAEIHDRNEQLISQCCSRCDSWRIVTKR